MPTFRSLLLVASVSVFLAGPAFADDDLGARLLDRVLCGKAPDPTPILLALAESGRIDVGAATARDGTRCWAFAAPFVIEGTTFDHVCASSEDPEAIRAHPELYLRAPGTSPGTSIALLSKAEPSKLADWSKSRRPDPQMGFEIAPSAVVPGETALSCKGFVSAEPGTTSADAASTGAPAKTAAPTPRPAGPAVPVHVPAVGGTERAAVSATIHAWLKTDGLGGDVVLRYEKIRSDGRYAYALARVRRPDGKPVPNDEWYGADGCENDPVPGLVEALLVDAASGWTIVRANRCADDVLITPQEAEKRFGLPADFVGRR